MQVLNIPRRLILLLIVASVLGSAALAVRAQDVPLESPVLVGAGDIAECGKPADEATANLLDTIPGTVYTTGDNAYPTGRLADFTNCYGPSWGRHKARTRPSLGNHDYDTGNANGYFSYFDATQRGPAPQGYYSYDLGTWHIVVLNSNCSEYQVGGCGVGDPQERWLRADLRAHPNSCILAYWHHPRFTSTNPGNDQRMQPFWQALYEAGAEVVLNGHMHNYERFALQDPQGRATPTGIREFVVGTGGGDLVPIGSPAANSEARNDTTFGVLKLTLHPASYDWQFVPVAGGAFTDAGSAACTPSTKTPPPPRRVYLPQVRR